MRDELKVLEGKVITVTGNFVRYGLKDGDGAKWNTAIITDVKRDGKLVSDHLWFTLIKDWLKTELTEGTKVKVTGVVYRYQRTNGSIDYGLCDTKKLVVLKKSKGELKPSKQWKHRGYDYFKFLTNTGPRWYRAQNENVQRIEFIFMGNGFQENVIQIKKDDSKYIKLIKSSILQ